ncbi:hypothetical protein ABFV51_28055, partial [Pseudomonas asgharzadehiana]
VNILAVSNADSARHERKESKSSWGGLKSSKVQDKVDEKRTTALGSNDLDRQHHWIECGQCVVDGRA